MVIGPKKLLELVKKIKLVENLSERELRNPEGAGFDLRLGEIYEIVGGKVFLGVEERETPKIKLAARYELTKLKRPEQLGQHKPPHKPFAFPFTTFTFTVRPGEFYLVTTIETVNLPLDICATFIPRTTTFRSGLFLRTGVAQPGYRGKLTFGLKNEGPIPVTLELGCRFVQALFHWVDGGGTQYRGQWQGGRVTTTKRERQL